MNKLLSFVSCVTALLLLANLSVAADSPKAPVASGSAVLTTKERSANVPLIPPPAARELKGKINTTGVAPVSISLVCLSSKTAAVPSGGHGMGCRETPPAVWQAQGCAAAMGCCQAANGCLVSSPANVIAGDGIY